MDLDELIKSRLFNGVVIRSRSRLAGRDSEHKRANTRSIHILSANRQVQSRGMRRTLRYAAVTKDEAQARILD